MHPVRTEEILQKYIIYVTNSLFKSELKSSSHTRDPRHDELC